MDNYRIQNPILLIVYKRIDTLQEIIKQLAKLKPSSIYIAANPHKNKEEEQQVKEVRNFLESTIQWQCNIHRFYRESHLSAKLSISSGISWFFSHEKQGIILEDDCLPTLSFFRFCDELLEISGKRRGFYDKWLECARLRP